MKELFDNFYKNKIILVTGHTGFKGSWLSIWLNEMGAKVIGYALDPLTSEDNFVQSKLSNKIIDIRGDIRDIDKLKSVFHKYNPDIVFHLAAQPLVRLSYDLPKETYEINVMGTLNVLECIRKTDSVKVGVMITTDKCYENKEQIWGYRENDTLGGHDPYSSSKACDEILIASYRNSFMNPNEYEKHGKAIASVRAGNVIGGGDWSRDRIVPDCIRALMKDEPIEIRNPNAVRPFQYVLEPLCGYLLLAYNMYKAPTEYYGAWNFGPDYNSIVSVKTLVDIVIDKWGKGIRKDIGNTKFVHESMLLVLDCTKAKTYLQWKGKLNITQAIENTVEWYKNYKSKDVYKLCVNEIKEYLELYVNQIW